MKYLPYSLSAVLLTPVVAMAGTVTTQYFDQWVAALGAFISTLIPLLLAFAVLVFIWGVIQYFVLGADDEGKRETGRAFMLYSLIGIVAIVAVWGLVGILLNLFGLSAGGTTPATPGLPSFPST